MCSPQALVLELQGLDALLLLLLLRLHLRHEARVDDEACIGRGTPWRQPARQKGADMAAAQQETPVHRRRARTRRLALGGDGDDAAGRRESP